METLFVGIVLLLACAWTVNACLHAYAAFEEARLNRVVADLNAAAAEYLRTHDKLPDDATIIL